MSRQIKSCHIRSSGHVGSQQIMLRSIQGQVNSRSMTSQSVNSGQIGNIGSLGHISGCQLGNIRSIQVISGQVGSNRGSWDQWR